MPDYDGVAYAAQNCVTVPPLPPDIRRRACRAVASRAADAGDLTELLDILGLTAEEGR